MKKLASIGFALLMIFAVFVPFVSANDGAVDGKGTLVVQLACRSPQIGGEFTIAPVIVSAPFTDAARVDKGFVDVFVKVVGAEKTERYLPDGTFDTRVEPGTYLLKQVDGNGGQPEFALATVNAGEKETVVFLGHGISGITETPKTVITVLEATYGMRKVVIDQAYVPGVPAVTHTVTHFNGNYEKHTSHGYTYYVHVGNNNGLYEKQHGCYVYVGTHTHTVIDVPAVPAVPEISHPEGNFVDVKAEVQFVLDEGVQNFVFDNAQNPGGIFSTANVLLKQIADPAYGQVKNVHIVYTVDGGEPKTVDAQEYQTISLV